MAGAIAVSYVLAQGGAGGGSETIAGKVTLYKSPECGCCENYATYLERGGTEVEVINRNDMKSVKERYGVPRSLESCHTTLVNDYVIEGHIPVEVVGEFLKEQPDTAGIALPGMPSGSPGMPGSKEAPFRIHKLTSEGEGGGLYTEF